MPTLVQRPSTEPAAATVAKRRPARRLKIFLAALAALLLHAVLIVLLAWALPHWPRPPLKKGPAPIQFVIQPPEPAATPDGLHKTETVPQQPEYMRTTEEQKADTPPPNPNFTSDKDTHAASEKPAEDSFKPLPTQDGKEIAAYDFTTNPYIPGQEAHDNSSTAVPAEPVPTPPPATPKPDAKESPTPRPANAKPTPTPGEFLTLKPDATPSNTPPEPSPSPPVESASTPPPPTPRQSAAPSQRNPSVNSTGPQQPRGYQPQTTQTKMAGSIDSRGKASVSALGTPLGKYQKAVEDAIGARWYFNVEENMSNLIRTGEVKVHFCITRNGKVINTRVSGPNQNTTLASISLEAVVNAEVPPIPSDVAAMLPEGQLEGDLSFIMY